MNHITFLSVCKLFEHPHYTKYSVYVACDRDMARPSYDGVVRDKLWTSGFVDDVMFVQ